MWQWLITRLEISHHGNAPLLAMEGLRGVAVFLVFLVHYSSFIEPITSGRTLDILVFVKHFGHLGVDLFFILSGYLIYGSIISKNKFYTKKYIYRRIKRIYPTFLVVFAIYILLSVIFPTESKIPNSLSNALIYLFQNLLLLPGLFDITPMITVAWSLSYEVFYYIAIPIVITLLNLRSLKTKSRMIIWTLVAVGGVIISQAYGTHVRLLMFVAGILLFEIINSNSNNIRHGGVFCFLMAISIFGLKGFWEWDNKLLIPIVFLLFLYFCLCAFNPNTKLNRLLSNQYIRWLGNMSYSYYLIHSLALNFLFMVLYSLTPENYSNSLIFYWLWIPAFAFTVFVSLFLYLFVEHPLSLSTNNMIKNASISRNNQSARRIPRA